MQKLDKILEEIENNSLEQFGHRKIIEIEKVKEIIHKHIDDDWTPVEERLPDENQEVWITTMQGEVRRAMYTEHLGNNNVKLFLLIGGTACMNEISAWQPYYVPEPYQTEKNS